VLFDAQSQGKNLARDECKMCILHVAEQKFRAGVNQGNTHSEVKRKRSYKERTAWLPLRRRDRLTT
jgi:hypothetical protein